MILVYVQSELRERSFPATDTPSGDGLGFEDRAKRRPTGSHRTVEKKNIGLYPGESQSSTAFHHIALTANFLKRSSPPKLQFVAPLANSRLCLDGDLNSTLGKSWKD